MKRRKPTGEAKVFQKIWFDRGPCSEVSNIYIYNPHPGNFAHILPKGENKYPQFKLLEENIWIMTREEHFSWDNERYKLDRNDPIWSKVFDKEEELLKLYNSKFPRY